MCLVFFGMVTAQGPIRPKASYNDTLSTTMREACNQTLRTWPRRGIGTWLLTLQPLAIRHTFTYFN